MDGEYDTDPYIFIDSQKVRPTEKGIEIEGAEGKIEMSFIRADRIDVMERIKCPTSP